MPHAINLEIGKSYTFKKHTHRGRPFIGKLVKTTARFATFENNGRRERVPVDLVKNEYQYKPNRQRANSTRPHNKVQKPQQRRNNKVEAPVMSKGEYRQHVRRLAVPDISLIW